MQSCAACAVPWAKQTLDSIRQALLLLGTMETWKKLIFVLAVTTPWEAHIKITDWEAVLTQGTGEFLPSPQFGEQLRSIRPLLQLDKFRGSVETCPCPEAPFFWNHKKKRIFTQTDRSRLLSLLLTDRNICRMTDGDNCLRWQSAWHSVSSSLWTTPRAELYLLPLKGSEHSPAEDSV